jgi:hypothetical protein
MDPKKLATAIDLAVHVLTPPIACATTCAVLA